MTMSKETMAFKRAKKRGNRAEIDFADMQLSFIRAEKTPGVDQVVKPKIYRTQSGKPVTIKSWTPGAKSPN
jgi:hypothetical protein